ncbi:MAG: hypothetical protein PHE27_01010 [Alphaproteobacteria bacterium]|nr:hypothetical protein [Alphaproteobacteria bacterium]
MTVSRLALLGLSACLAALPARAQTLVPRETRTFSVNGQQETWQLAWSGAPDPSRYCGPDKIEDLADTCGCDGFSYAEVGELWLIRTRGGKEIERLSLGAPFEPVSLKLKKGEIPLRRWPAQNGDVGRKRQKDPTLLPEIQSRPAPEIMAFADYDRDGAASEFLLQVSYASCGTFGVAAVGVSKANPHLHILSSEAHPEKPLVLPREAWDALAQSGGPHTLTLWECGNHGETTGGKISVSAQKGRLNATLRKYSCPRKESPEQLLEETAQ